MAPCDGMTGEGGGRKSEQLSCSALAAQITLHFFHAIVKGLAEGAGRAMALLGYARLSTAEQAAGQALDQQLKRLQDAGCPEVLHDIASGSDDSRPQLKKLLDRLEPGDTVIATRLDRLTRSARFNAELCELFSQDNGPRLRCLDDSIDTSTVMGRASFRMSGVFAQAEVERIRERVQHGMAHRRDVIGAYQGRAPFGFKRAPGENWLSIDPEAAPVAKQLINEFIRTADARHCCGWLKDQHGLSMTGKGLRYWLLNPCLVGDTGRTQTKQFRINPETGKKTRISVPPGKYERIDSDTHKPLISRSTWSAVHRALDVSSRSTGGARRGNLKPEWFSSRCICSECGNKMRQHGRLIHCTTESCGSRYSKGSIMETEARQSLLAALQMIGLVLADRLAPLQAAAHNVTLEGPPGAAEISSKIAALRATGLAEVAPVIATLEAELQRLCQRSAGFQQSEAEALAGLVKLIGSRSAIQRLTGEQLLAVCRDAEIEVVLHQQQVAWVTANRWEGGLIGWYLTARGTQAVLMQDLNDVARVEQAMDRLVEELGPPSDRMLTVPDGDEPLIQLHSWRRPRRMRVS